MKEDYILEIESEKLSDGLYEELLMRIFKKNFVDFSHVCACLIFCSD